VKKQFPLTHPKKQPARQLEAVKAEISKYLKRERKKPLPEGVDFWDFDCRCGPDEAAAEPVHVAELPKQIEALQAGGTMECYVEILAKPGKRAKKSESS
jgi:hypothetical protein